MDKRDNVSGDRQRGVKVEEKVLEEPQSPLTVPLRLKLDVRYIIQGPVTGNRYEWNRAGSVVAVELEDAEELLAKRTAKACCSGTPQMFIFEIVGD